MTGLQVWYGPMPESNGKSNFTAILHKGDLVDGHTIARSEYPDRVRYEADRVRFLLGELAESPDILAYDADKHSGYVPPTNSPTKVDEMAVAKAIMGEFIKKWFWPINHGPIYFDHVNGEMAWLPEARAAIAAAPKKP